MVIGEREDEACARFLVAIQEFLWLPIQKRPLRAQILISKLGWVSVVLHMIFVLLRAFDVHVSCLPVALFRNTLWAPVGPDSELGILIPFRSFVI